MSEPLPIDFTLLSKGRRIRARDGTVLIVRGSYMAPDGLVITARDGEGPCDRNVPIRDIVEILES